ncbi:SDR family NAD(P)-dependent oxidoreductase [Actinacidiphila acidipaludis]|uniref:SDR family oxidoreductase n=1 Tax=Actinacidiphila acidipaludis TaxID=2873382 RepID=A0ABS7Q9V1_9ACTN|nr:SDR family oxidoreductase [Streptomyces acidipaludis]MBY8879926.1 SDR family oxidoreductase [Streptomyces acidipaludis]
MDIEGRRILLPGATGVIGGALAERLHAHGARLAMTGRDPAALARVAAACGGPPTRVVDAYDLDGCARAPEWAADGLGGLDTVIVCIGVAGFGPVPTVSDAVAEHLFTVNALAPMALLRASLAFLPRGGALAAVTGAVVDTPTAGMADYTASKAALSAWLSAVRREQRRAGVAVLDVRLPHVESGFSQRAVAGGAPSLPQGLPVNEAVDVLIEALTADPPPGEPRPDRPHGATGRPHA